MNDCMDSLGHAKMFTTLEYNFGYWKLPVREKDKIKIRFLFIRSVIPIKSMAYRLVNALVSFL